VLFASDLPALLKSEPAIKVDVAEPTLSVLAPVACQPTISPDSGTPPPPLRSIKSEIDPTKAALALTFRSTKRSSAAAAPVVTKSGGGGTVKLETREVELETREVEDGADSLGERVKKRRRAAAPPLASVKTETSGR
jgi:hypothetical protein